VDQNSKNSWCHENIPHDLKPGDYAQNASFCYSGQIDKNGFCIGKSSGNCKSHIDCDIGLFCESDTKICVKAIEENGYCDDKKLCQSYLTCYENTCKKYGHLNIGMKVSEKGNSENCISNFMDSETRICEKGPILITNTNPIKLNTWCGYTYKDTIIRRWPTCGYSKTGSLLCPKLEGDLEKSWLALLKYMDQKPICHVLHKYGVCEKIEMIGCENYINGLKSMHEGIPLLASNLEDFPECLKNTMFKDYWYPNCAFRSFGKNLNFIGFPLIFLVILTLI